jgi:hypothetical protein
MLILLVALAISLLVRATRAAEVDPDVLLRREFLERYDVREPMPLTDCFKTDRKLRDVAEGLTRRFSHMRCARHDQDRELMVGLYVTVHDMRRDHWMQELRDCMDALGHLAFNLEYGLSHVILYDPLDLNSLQGAQFQCEFGSRSYVACKRPPVIEVMRDARLVLASALNRTQEAAAQWVAGAQQWLARVLAGDRQQRRLPEPSATARRDL